MTIPVKQLPISERPYEKLELYGAEMLSNAELIAIIIKTGTKEKTVLELAQKVLNLREKEEDKQLRFLQEISIEEFMDIKGIGKIKAIQLKAVCELAKRMARPVNSKTIVIKSSKDIANLLMGELQFEKREIAKIIILNNKNVILKIKDISLGGTNFAMIEPKEILVDAIKMQAPKLILVHNHPSGDPTPSKGDYIATQKLIEATEIMGIELLDHIVIGDNKYESIFANKEELPQ